MGNPFWIEEISSKADNAKCIFDEVSKDENPSFEYTVSYIVYRNSETKYSILKGKATRYNGKTNISGLDITVVGIVNSVKVDDKFDVEGEWIDHKKFGLQFVGKSFKISIPTSQNDLEIFLRRYCTGVGPKTAKVIVSNFKENTLEIIKNDWEKLLELPRMSRKKAMKIHEDILNTEAFEKLSIFVIQCGGSVALSMKFFNTFGDSAFMQIKENPYIVCSIKGVGFLTAEKFALKLGQAADSAQRIQAGILYYINFQMESNGHMYLEQKELTGAVVKFLSKSTVYPSLISEDLVKKEVSKLVEDKRLNSYINTKNQVCIYGNSGNYVEDYIAKQVKSIYHSYKEPIATKPSIENFIAEHESIFKINFADAQKSAIAMALTSGLSILTGGPGTGKTQTINTVIKAVKHFRPESRVKLAAPTGKAAIRMTELTGMHAETIHKLAKIFSENDEGLDIIDADYIIIDEASMIDAFLFKKFLKVVSEDARILIVGDYDQLPSVGPGLVLRDLINSNTVPVTRLTEIFRQAKDSQIAINSHRLMEGKKSDDADGLVFDHDLDQMYFIKKSHEERIKEAVLLTIEKLIENKGYKLSDIQVLSPMRKGTIGVIELNAAIQERFNPRHEKKPETTLYSGTILRLGDKVMQTKNDYDADVFNGEVGIIKYIENDEDGNLMELIVEYDGRDIIYTIETVENVVLAYAITIHKSQGSEFPVVILPIASSQKIMLSRNLVYTAWTRAREKVVNIGETSALDYASARTDNTVRNSNIKEKLVKVFSR